MTLRKKISLALMLAAAIAMLFGAFSGSAATVSVSSQPADYDVYLKLDGIDGEATARGFEKWIALSSVQFGLSSETSLLSAGSGAARGKATPSPVVATKRPDTATVPLFLATASGTFVKKGVIAFVSPGERPRTVLSYELSDVAITSYEADNAFETISLSYSAISISYTGQKPDGSAAPAVKGGWSFLKNTKL